MDLSLVPICNDNDHILEYKYKPNIYCVICNKKGISNYCIHCDYSRCAKCNKNIIDKKRRDTFKDAVMNHKKKERLRKEQNKLNNDGMNHWIVKISDKKEKDELYYINRFTNTISFDYPKLFVAPTSSSEEEPIIKEELIVVHKNESRILKCIKKTFHLN
tara:strand:- start:86 stop:565 length:480 start_codon:yes stop_codon:yes gene_type:complete